jgi:hypothetical protein
VHVAESSPNVSAYRLAAVLWLLSFSCVVFTIAVFRLLTFFIMPSLFFDLLFVGFPLGAMFGVRFFKISERSFFQTLYILQVTMVIAVLALLVCKHYDYLRAHMFDIELSRLLLQMGVLSSLFLPFFCAYGLTEYLGYRLGCRGLGGRMAYVYPLYLVGAAAAYLFVELTLSTIGVARVLILTFVFVAVGMALLASTWRARCCLAIQFVCLMALLFTPQIDRKFVDLYKGRSNQSTYFFAREGYRPVMQEWGKYSLVEIMHRKNSSGDYYLGFYNDIFQWEYSPVYGFITRSLGMVPIDRVGRGAKIAIIGSGGGRQVQYAQQSHVDAGEIVAIEIESAVLNAVRGDLVAEFGDVYESSRVRVVNQEARGYLESSQEKFDLVYLPSVGGYPQMMLEPGNMIRTEDAFRVLRDHLTDKGVLAIWYPAGLDQGNILTSQYVRTLTSPELGMHVRAYLSGDIQRRTSDEVLILAVRDESVALPSVEDLQEFFHRPTSTTAPLAARPSYGVLPVPVVLDPAFRPITDAQPFLAGNVQNILSMRQVYQLFGVVAMFLVICGTAVLWKLKQISHTPIPGRSFAQVVLFGALIGANFLVVEHLAILVLFKRLYLFHDAVVLGAIGFLVVSSLGSILITPRLQLVLQVLSSVCVILVWIFSASLGPTVALLLLLPAAFVTGSFFPALFDAAAENPLAVFAADAVGAAAGSLTAFFLPIAFGFSALHGLAALLFLATAICCHWFFSSQKPQVDSPVNDS